MEEGEPGNEAIVYIDHGKLHVYACMCRPCMYNVYMYVELHRAGLPVGFLGCIATCLTIQNGCTMHTYNIYDL